MTDIKYNVTIVKSLKENLLMNEFIADKLIEDLRKARFYLDRYIRLHKEHKDGIDYHWTRRRDVYTFGCIGAWEGDDLEWLDCAATEGADWEESHKNGRYSDG